MGASNWTNADNIVDDSTSTYGYWDSTSSQQQVLDSHTGVGDSTRSEIITIVELRVYGDENGIISSFSITPDFDGASGDLRDLDAENLNDEWSQWYDITNDTNAPGSWTWEDLATVGVTLEATMTGGSGEPIDTARIYKVELRVTYEN